MPKKNAYFFYMLDYIKEAKEATGRTLSVVIYSCTNETLKLVHKHSNTAFNPANTPLFFFNRRKPPAKHRPRGK